jgi:hypothetical protein
MKGRAITTQKRESFRLPSRSFLNAWFGLLKVQDCGCLPSWTTDAPFRETNQAIKAARKRGVLAVEMEAAALYAFATAKRAHVLCVAHVTNTMGLADQDFEKGEADGAADALRLLEALIKSSSG